MEGSIRNLYHYPIKGLSGQELVKAELKRGQGFPFDRIFGFARHDSGFDINDPRPIPKDRFLVLLTEERLAGLQTSFEPSSRIPAGARGTVGQISLKIRRVVERQNRPERSRRAVLHQGSNSLDLSNKAAVQSRCSLL